MTLGLLHSPRNTAIYKTISTTEIHKDRYHWNELNKKNALGKPKDWKETVPMSLFLTHYTCIVSAVGSP